VPATELHDGPGYGVGLRYVQTTDPGAVGAFEQWFDGTNLYIRNAANTAWVTIGAGGTTPPLAEVLAQGADANGVTITDLGAGSNPTDAAQLDQAGGGSFTAATRTVSLVSFAPDAIAVGTDPLIPELFRDNHNNNVTGAALTALLAAMGLVWDGTAGTLAATKDVALAIDFLFDLVDGPLTSGETASFQLNESYGAAIPSRVLFSSAGVNVYGSAFGKAFPVIFSASVALETGDYISFLQVGQIGDTLFTDWRIRIVQVA
jgi:hypothetical protein